MFLETMYFEPVKDFLSDIDLVQTLVFLFFWAMSLEPASWLIWYLAFVITSGLVLIYRLATLESPE
jgi:hypothetical protein